MTETETGTHEPTFSELLKVYQEAAGVERIKSGRPSAESARGVVRSVARILRGCRLARARRAGELTRERLDKYLTERISEGLSALSARTYMEHLRAVTPRWARPYFAARGLAVKPFDVPEVYVRPHRYVRPAKAALARVRAWYAGLRAAGQDELWIAATMMLEFAMRNGDIARLEWRDFIEKEDGLYLYYVPHKTALSSGRFVCWPVHAEVWRGLAACRREGAQVLPRARFWLRRLNGAMRELGFGGSKASYELRKICIDHVYQKWGAEMASSISGDDIRTVTRYYADPAAVSVRDVRIVDLL